MYPKSKSQTKSSSSKTSSDTVVDRIGRVTIYRRRKSYWLYYREDKKTVRLRLDGNLATARASASQVNAALEEDRPSPFGFRRIDVSTFIEEYVDSCKLVRNLSPNTVRRYEAALSHFEEFVTRHKNVATIDRISENIIEDFIKFMRSRTRVRNGAKKGKAGPYRIAGIKFILSTCRSAFNFAKKRRYLPPYSENPFSSFSIDKMRDRDGNRTAFFTPKQLQDFFANCDRWQFPIFFTLALYGIRVGELTHLLISDIDFDQDIFTIRSKPEMLWYVKTNMQRVLPIIPEVKKLILPFIGSRKEGFVFIDREHFEGRSDFEKTFNSPMQFRSHLKNMINETKVRGLEDEIEIKKTIRPFLRNMGQIPEKKIRLELMKITKKIGCPEITKAHSLRHLFATAAQENGMNPITVQGILGHSSLDMTRLYTHMGIADKRKAVSEFLHGQAGFGSLLEKRI